MDYVKCAKIHKAMSDDTRLQIIDLLSCEELCACDILGYFSISQSTLSYHMNYLIDSELVVSRKVGSWVKYSLNNEVINDFISFNNKIFDNYSECICKTIKKNITCKV